MKRARTSRWRGIVASHGERRRRALAGPRVWLLGAALAFGCTGGDASGKAAPTDTSATADTGVCPPVATATPASVAFGDVPVGAPATQEVRITNDGCAPLELRSLALEEPAGPFAVGALASLLVAPGEHTAFSVTFDPEAAGAWSTRVGVETNDPATATLTIPLEGTGLSPTAVWSPLAYDFGAVRVGCTSTQAVTLANVGNAALVVTDFTFFATSDELVFDWNEASNGPLPWTLAPGATYALAVTYTPVDTTADSALYSALTNETFRLAVATVEGVGAEADPDTPCP